MKIVTNQMLRRIAGNRVAAGRVASGLLSFGLAAATGIAASGCGYLNRTTNAGLPESEMSTTAVGAASGAVIGGGLGAIVGSTSGSAGEGVAIGAVAGAATGAGIGYQLERDQHALSDHRKSLEAQQELIARQGEEINELKHSTADRGGSDRLTTPELGMDITPGRSSRSAAKSGTALSAPTKLRGSGSSGTTNGIRDGYRGNPRAKPFSASGEYSNRAVANASARGRLRDHQDDLVYGSASAVPASVKRRQESAPPESVRLTSVRSPSPKVQELNEAPAVANTAVKCATTTAARTSASAVSVGGLTAGGTSGLPPARLEAPKGELDAPEVVKEEPAKKSVAKATSPKDQGDCLQATKEAERGLNASSDADRIFYLRRAARLCADEPAYHVELGKLYSEIGKHSDAKFEFRQAIDLDPDNQIARDELSILENSGGQ